MKQILPAGDRSSINVSNLRYGNNHGKYSK